MAGEDARDSLGPDDDLRERREQVDAIVASAASLIVGGLASVGHADGGVAFRSGTATSIAAAVVAVTEQVVLDFVGLVLGTTHKLVDDVSGAHSMDLYKLARLLDGGVTPRLLWMPRLRDWSKT